MPMKINISIWHGGGEVIPAMWHVSSCGLNEANESLETALVKLAKSLAANIAGPSITRS